MERLQAVPNRLCKLLETPLDKILMLHIAGVYKPRTELFSKIKREPIIRPLLSAYGKSKITGGKQGGRRDNHKTQLKKFNQYAAGYKKSLANDERKLFFASISYLRSIKTETYYIEKIERTSIPTRKDLIFQRNATRGMLKINELFHWLTQHNIESLEWESNFQKLYTYHLEYRALNNPNFFPELSLIGWIQKQRANKKTLSPDQIQRLTQINFIWNYRSIIFTRCE